MEERQIIIIVIITILNGSQLVCKIASVSRIAKETVQPRE